MKKLILVLLFLGIAGVVLANPDYYLSRAYSTSQLIKTGHAVIYDATVYYGGVTAGDSVEIVNGLTANGTSVMKFAAPAANGAFLYNPPTGILCDTGIYLTETKSGGTFKTYIKWQ